jgi:predicted DNA-binding mobile mystery protein A
MTIRTELNQAQLALDARLPQMKAASRALTRPQGGWIQAIRLAFGMSVSDLARRVGSNPSTILRIEDNEVAGTVNLETLARMAQSLDCDLVYALVPKTTVEGTIKRRALAVASAKFKRTQQTMALENQALDATLLRRLVENEAEVLARSRKLWKEKLPDD